jgi:hypothetical protein
MVEAALLSNIEVVKILCFIWMSVVHKLDIFVVGSRQTCGYQPICQGVENTSSG